MAIAAVLTVVATAVYGPKGFLFGLVGGFIIDQVTKLMNPELDNLSGGATTTVKESSPTQKIVYGKTRVGGSIVFVDITGTDNEYLHLLVCFASHEVEDIEKIYFNDKEAWNSGSGGTKVSPFNAVISGAGGNPDDPYVTVDLVKGSQTGAIGALVSRSSYWTTDHKNLGHTMVYLRLMWDSGDGSNGEGKSNSLFPQGIPNVTALIKGKKVYDPRKDSTSAVYDSSLGTSTHRLATASTWEWSQNPALIVRDYMTDDKFGLKDSDSLINLASLAAAANICDQSVTLADSSTQKRYECDGRIDSGKTIKTNLEGLLASMAGTLVYSGGEYFINAGAYVSPSLTLTESDIVSDIKVTTKTPRKQQYNAVKGQFLSAQKNYIPMEYPAFISSTYATEDGEPLYLDVPLHFVTDDHRAQRIAKLKLLKSRQQTVATFSVNLIGLKLKCGDTISVTNTKMGWSSKVFEVIDYSINPQASGTIAVTISCVETASAVYDWATSDEQTMNFGGTITLPNGSTVNAPTSLSVSNSPSVQNDGSILPAANITWTASTGGGIARYEVQYKKSSDSDYTVAGYPQDSPFRLEPLLAGTNYDIRIRALNYFGVKSDWATASSQSVTGDTTAPSAPTSLAVSAGVKQLSLTWTKPTADDYSHSEVYEHTSNSSGSATKIGTASGAFTRSGLGTGVTRYYWVKGVDYSGNTSGFSSVASGTTLQVGSTDIETAGVATVNLASASVNTIKLGANAVTVPVGGSFSANSSNTTTTTHTWNSPIIDMQIDFGSDSNNWPTDVYVIAGINFLRTTTSNTSASTVNVKMARVNNTWDSDGNLTQQYVFDAGSDMGQSVTAGFSTCIETGCKHPAPSTRYMNYRLTWRSTIAGQFSQGACHMLVIATKR